MSTHFELPNKLTRSSDVDFDSIAMGLGWFSVGLGLAETLAPRLMARLIGISDGAMDRASLRSPLFGPREIAAGIGILTQSRRAGWMWARVAGDALDIGSLALALKHPRNNRARLSAALISVIGVTALDYACAQRLTTADGAGANWQAPIRKSIRVNKPVSEIYAFWRRFENIPRFMQHLESVEELGEKTSRWRARGPFGKTLEWQSIIEQERPDYLISWKSVDGSVLENSGTVRFEPEPGGSGTIIHVELRYQPPGGAIARTFADFLGAGGERMLEDDLRAFKQIIETGEIIRSDASVHSRMHAAQPTANQSN